METKCARVEARARGRSLNSALAREVWRRFTLAPGVELHVPGALSLPSPGKLAELVNWCRQNFPGADLGLGSDARLRPRSDPV